MFYFMKIKKKFVKIVDYFLISFYLINLLLHIFKYIEHKFVCFLQTQLFFANKRCVLCYELYFVFSLQRFSVNSFFVIF